MAKPRAQVTKRETVSKPVDLALWKLQSRKPDKYGEPEMVDVDYVTINFDLGNGEGGQTRRLKADALDSYAATYGLEILEKST